MGKPVFSEDFKRDAVHQIAVQGYPVREVSERLRVSTHSVHQSMKTYAWAASQAASVDHEAENRRLKRELARMGLATRQPTDLVLQALLMAVWRRKPKLPVLIHTDQGSQYTSRDWAAFLRPTTSSIR